MPTRRSRWLDAHNLSQAADIYIARLIGLLWECDDEFDLAADFELAHKEVRPSVTDIPGVRRPVRVPWLLVAKTHGRLIVNRRARGVPFRHSSIPLGLGFGATLTSAQANCNAKSEIFVLVRVVAI